MMKKFLFSFAVLVAMVFVVSCGGDDDDSGGYGDGEEGYSDSGNGGYEECYPADEGGHTCKGNTVYTCSDGRWIYDEYCPNGCSYGSCNSSSGGGSGSGSGSSSECSYGDYKCDGDSSYRCSGGSWSYDDYCDYGCNYSTGKCNSSSGGGSGSGGGSTSECSSGEYRCYANYSQRCSSGKWVNDKDCTGIGNCNDSTGKCRTKDEMTPCPPKLNGSVSGTSVKLSWSYSTSATCGTPTTATLKVYDGESEWDIVESKNASSFKSYTLPASVWAYYFDGAGQYMLKAGVLIENEAGQASATCVCLIDDKSCTCG